jgi:hypothetical protein
MRLLSKIITIATVPAWMCLHVGPAAAQTFDERWSIIPKAHAEPAPETPHAEPTPATPEEKKPDLQRDLRSEESLHMVVRRIAQPLDHSTEFFPERPHIIRIRQGKQRTVHRSIGICQLQHTAACRSAREFALLILRPTDR